MKKEWLGFVLLPLGVTAIVGGFRFSAGGNHLGWLAVVLGIVSVVFAYRVMRPADGVEEQQQ